MAVDVKVGLTDNPRELTIGGVEGDVAQAVEAVLAGTEPVLRLQDEKGRRYLVPVARIAYVEIGAGDSRKVGFTA